MGYKIRQGLVIAILLFLVVSFCTTEAKAKFDYSLIEIALEEFQKLSPTTKTQAINLLRSYIQYDMLDDLKEELPYILRFVIGDDYESKLQQKRVTMSQLYSEIDKLKTWDKDDLMSVIDMIESNRAEDIKKLMEKYENDDAVPENRGPSGETPDILEELKPNISDEFTQFTDIQDHWAKDYIEFIASKGIIKGKASGIFAPDDNVTRAEFTAMLVRLLGLEADAMQSLPFSDVAENDWFHDVVSTAYSAGLIQGKGNLFDPNGLITREEMVVLVVRAVSSKCEASQLADDELEELLSRFIDKDEISPWARAETAVGLKLGLIQGTAHDRFQPKTHATRAQAATVMYKLYNALY